MLETLAREVMAHTGRFRLVEIRNERSTKTVNFRHVSAPPGPDRSVPAIQGLQEFYETFGQLTLYMEEVSGEAAYSIASPSQWADLKDGFQPWLDGVDPEDADGYLPGWMKDYVVVGEIPRSGNYLLVPLSGPEAGKVFEFEHDGFEFLELGTSLPEFVQRALDLDDSHLKAIASHMRFRVDGDARQWWIEEMTDNRGNVAHTKS